MEYFDLLDENGNKTGKTKLRSEVHRDGDWHRGVFVLLINSKMELLIQKRSPNKKSHPNEWELSATGHIKAGQTSLQAAVGEVKEEIGVNIRGDDLEYLFEKKTKSIQNNGTFINSEFGDVYLVERDLDTSGLVLQEEEVSEVKLIDFREFEKQIKAGDKDIIPHSWYPKLFDLLRERYK